MSDIYYFLTQHPFFTGFLTGLIVAFILWVRGLLKLRSLRREIESLKESLYTKLTIEAKGNMSRENELEGLKRQNENLRITVRSLRQKPGRAEILQLHVYDKAIHTMLARAPGFAPTWEMVVHEAEDEIRQTETGISAFFRRVFISQNPVPKESGGTKLIDHDKKEE